MPLETYKKKAPQYAQLLSVKTGPLLASSKNPGDVPEPPSQSNLTLKPEKPELLNVVAARPPAGRPPAGKPPAAPPPPSRSLEFNWFAKNLPALSPRSWFRGRGALSRDPLEVCNDNQDMDEGWQRPTSWGCPGARQPPPGGTKLI